MSSMLTEFTSWYDAYVDTFRATDGSLPAMMQLKRAHTERVVANAQEIADGEGFDAATREAALIAALLHDTGRYEQLKRYNTFRDSESVDHAVFSHDIVVEKGWLDGGAAEEEQGEGGSWKAAVLKAILYHNRRELPEGLDAQTEALAHTVRDADKLDIFRVLEDRVQNTDWRKDTRAFWNLEIVAAPSSVVVEAIAERRPVDYQNIRTLADFVLIQVGWMMHELHFAASRRLCVERGHLAFRRAFLHQLTDDPAVDRLCALAEKGLRA